MKYTELARQAFFELYPDKESSHELSLKYSGQFNGYNSNVRIIRNNIEFKLSKKWRTISREIQIGLMQSLLLKLFKDRKTKPTTNMDLYNLFMKNVHISIPKTESEPILEDSFNRVNEKYFNGLIEKPNLSWGSSSLRKLGSYEYGSDMIKISTVFQGADSELLDCIMYHEMLHKKHKFKNKNLRSYHHTREFREKEKEFENSEEIEEKLKRFLGRKNLRFAFRFF